MKKILVGLLSLMVCIGAFANVEPTVNIISAEMRSGTSVMDVVYRVDDPNDATVKTRALAFIDGERSFANVIRPEAWVDGTEANLGDAIATGVDHTLSWDVAADWNTDLGNLKFEVLCRESDGLLLAIDWLTIPAAGGKLELTMSENSPADSDVLDAFFWQYGDFDPDMSVTTNGNVMGTATSGEYAGITLIEGNIVQTYGLPYICRAMDLDPASAAERRHIYDATGGQLDLGQWYVISRPYQTIDVIWGWGYNYDSSPGQHPRGVTDIKSISAGNGFNLALADSGTVVAWGGYQTVAPRVPTDLLDVIAIAAGGEHCLILTHDRSIKTWWYRQYADSDYGLSTVPDGLTNVIAIAAGAQHSLAVTSDGKVTAWGRNNYGQCTVPEGLTNVVAVAGGGEHSLALSSDGTVAAWGRNFDGQCTVPEGLANVTAIAAADEHSLALTDDGTVVAWGENNEGQSTVPGSLTNVIAISASYYHSLALTSNGTVVAWGKSYFGETIKPMDLTGITLISAGAVHNLVIKPAP